MRTISMENAQESYNHEEEVRYMDISMGNSKIDSNGHGKDRPEYRDLKETIRISKWRCSV